ncbi:MAG: hydrogen gas-evolving membrane-bound hydrogenase subunit E [Verrucomicrobiota bacterium]
MESLLLLLALPAALALLVLVGGVLVRRGPLLAGGLIALAYGAAAVWLLWALPTLEEVLWSRPWVEALGMNLALRLTPFTAWFGAIIFGIGGCIALYASGYFAQDRRLPFLLGSLGLFTTAMLGVLWSDNLLLLFLFWEGTSLLSFLLVGFNHGQALNRQKASQALLVTFLGGAALLAGILLVQAHYGTVLISQLLAMENPDAGGPIGRIALLLIAVGALTKSAQWPFHFWLPNAMAGPTPVSAYLHSATMVKAGVFLLATLAPLLRDHPIWTPLLVICGILTVLTAVLRAAREDDLKSILASTTLGALGFLTVLAGVGSPSALLGFVIFLTAHAFYKAPLFLCAGNLEKSFGTRNLSQLRGAARKLPVTGLALTLSTLSLVGVAPLPGFLGKEYLLKAAWAYSPWVALGVAFAAAGVLALGLRFLIPLWLPDRDAKSPKKLPVPLSLAACLPALGAIALAFSLPQASHRFLGPAATSLGAYAEASYQFWYGWTPALFLSLGAIAFSLVLTYFLSRPHRPALSPTWSPLFEPFYHTVIAALRQGASAFAKWLVAGSLSRQLLLMLAFVGTLSLLALQPGNWPRPELSFPPQSLGAVGIALLLGFATVAAARSRRLIPLLVSLGMVGLLVAALFLWFSAPDLALTQLLAETLLLFLLVGALGRCFPQKIETHHPVSRLVIASATGLLVSALVFKAMLVGDASPLAAYFLNTSLPEAYGANVVNVILVDFRALDTFGEITVLAIAGWGLTAALGARRASQTSLGTFRSPWIETARRPFFFVLLPVALWTFWRGHNEPGGGFIGALVAGAAVGYCLLSGIPRQERLVDRLAFWLPVAGLLTALVAALSPLLVGKAFFQGLWWHSGDLHLGTPLLFDLGVFLTVIGFTLSYLRRTLASPTA